VGLEGFFSRQGFGHVNVVHRAILEAQGINGDQLVDVGRIKRVLSRDDAQNLVS
jgi:hypothetical protein